MNDEVVYVDKSKLTAIADAIRAKTGGSAELTVDEMASEIATTGDVSISSAKTVKHSNMIGRCDIPTSSTSALFLCKTDNGNDVIAYPATGNDFNEFRVVAKVKFNSTITTTVKRALFGPYSGNLPVQPCCEIGKWNDTMHLFCSFGLPASYNSFTWRELDLNIADYDFDITKYYYFSCTYDSTTQKSYVAMYDENGTLIKRHSGSVTTIYRTSNAYCFSFGINGIANMFGGDIVANECFVELNNTVIWGNKTSKTAEMGQPWE